MSSNVCQSSSKNPKRVVVALSGGVDSAVAAALLVEQGLEVVGLTFRFWLCEDNAQKGETASAALAHKSCCGVDGVASARAAASALGIPHYVVDSRPAFDRRVLRPAWQAYDQGRTPNPCVLCNSEIKFGALLSHAKRVGADCVATGHHARIERRSDGILALMRGRDPQKDQSYFLFALSDAQLAAAIFPVGEMIKDEVRDRARALGLSAAERPESQDACLGGPDLPFSEALRRRFDGVSRPGAIVDAAGRVLGQHDGIHHFTLGQRRGLGVALGEPAYVSQLRHESAEVVVSTELGDLECIGLEASGAHWHGGGQPPKDLDRDFEVQIRYRHRAVLASCQTDGPRVRVRFQTPQRAVTPGQAAVFYRADRVLGGAWIDRGLPCQ